MSDVLLCLQKSATKALMIEVQLAPKPGLVDRLDNGAHKDMNIFTFMESIFALQPYFYQYAYAGYYHQGSPRELFDKIRHIGQEAEKSMLDATNGINTHKGANFSFAIILSAIGNYLQKTKSSLKKIDKRRIRLYIQEMTHHLIEEDLKKSKNNTSLSNGEKLFLKYGITGIRGQAAMGYPDLFDYLLPYFYTHLPIKKESQLLRGLLFLMKNIEDSNLIHRGGITAWHTVQEEAQQISLIDDEKNFIESLTKYNKLLKNRYLSPGGSADILSLAIFWLIIEEQIILPLK